MGSTIDPFPYAKIKCARFKGATKKVFLDQTTINELILQEAGHAFQVQFIKKGPKKELATDQAMTKQGLSKDQVGTSLGPSRGRVRAESQPESGQGSARVQPESLKEKVLLELNFGPLSKA